MDMVNAKRGYTERDLRDIIEYQRKLIHKYGDKSASVIREAVKRLRWAFDMLHR